MKKCRFMSAIKHFHEVYVSVNNDPHCGKPPTPKNYENIECVRNVTDERVIRRCLRDAVRKKHPEKYA
jgi:hypothetical protein